jgi:chromate transporter
VPVEQRQRVPAHRLFLAFLRLGATAFGGPAMVAYIGNRAVDKHRWLSQELFQDGVALCQSIPGATAMQTAAYVGLRAGGPAGALAAFVGFGLPAFVLMIILSALYQKTQDLQPVIAAFRGLHLIVISLIANAAVNFGRSSIRNWRDLLLAAGAAVFLILHGNPILAIAGAALLGLLIYQAADVPAAGPPASLPSQSRRRSWMPWTLIPLMAIGLAVLFVLSRQLFDLSAMMLKIDLFAFGGGFASVPLMLHEVVDVRHWLSAKTFMDGIALGQVTPGPIVITATFVGYQIAGLAGAVVGTVSIFSPSFFMVLATVPYLDRVQHNAAFRKTLRGVLASFVGLLAAVAVHFGMAVSWTIPSIAVAAAAFVALRLKVDILWVVMAGGVVSVLCF